MALKDASVAVTTRFRTLTNMPTVWYFWKCQEKRKYPPKKVTPARGCWMQPET